MCNCLKLFIPIRLIKNGRLTENNFQYNEYLFLRFPLLDPHTQTSLYNFQTKKIEAAAFAVKNTSCNRGKYSHPKDVLYNHKKCVHHSNDGVASLYATHPFLLCVKHPIIENTFYTLKVTHDPDEFMYPHSEIRAYENDSKIEEIKAGSIKLIIRNFYATNCQIHIEPKIESFRFYNYS